MKQTSAIAVFASLSIVGACGPADYSSTQPTCGDGAVVPQTTVLACFYTTEQVGKTGFGCPPTAPYYHQVDGGLVCYESDNLPDDIKEEIERANRSDVDDTCAPQADGSTEHCHYRFVVIDDHTNPRDGEAAPGVDIDSITLTKADGTVVPAQATYLAENAIVNSSAPLAVLGLPDAGCNQALSERYYSMTGEGSTLVVGFGSTTIEPGDRIGVVTLGSECGQGFVDETFSVCVGATLDSFISEATCVGSCAVSRTKAVAGRR